jgi:hypothetical protein
MSAVLRGLGAIVEPVQLSSLRDYTDCKTTISIAELSRSRAGSAEPRDCHCHCRSPLHQWQSRPYCASPTLTSRRPIGTAATPILPEPGVVNAKFLTSERVRHCERREAISSTARRAGRRLPCRPAGSSQ